MRGHSKGPFSNISSTDPVNPVNRVQRQIRLGPNEEVQIYCEASPAQPVLLRILAWVVDAFSTGTSTLLMGTPSNDDEYLASGDTALGTPGSQASSIKTFLLTANTTIIALVNAVADAASKALTISAITAANTQTVTIGGQVYTFLTVLVDTANNVLIGADATAMGDNLAAAINAGAGAGILYGTGTVANASVSAVAALGVVTVTALVAGTAGNSIAISETLTNSAWAGGATTLSGGEDIDDSGDVFIFLDA